MSKRRSRFEWQWILLGVVFLVGGILLVPVFGDGRKGAVYGTIILGPVLIVAGIYKTVRNFLDGYP